MIYDNIQLSYLLFPLFLFKKTDIYTNMIFYYTRTKTRSTEERNYLKLILEHSCRLTYVYQFLAKM